MKRYQKIYIYMYLVQKALPSSEMLTSNEQGLSLSFESPVALFFTQ